MNKAEVQKPKESLVQEQPDLGGRPHGVPALRPPPPKQEQKARRQPWLWAGAALVGLILAGLAYLQPWVAHPAQVVIETATLAPATRVLAVNGQISAAHSVEVRPMVSGALEAVLVAEGDKVATGQDLARVNTAAQNSLIRQAVAGLDAALVAQEQARATYQRSLALGGTVARTVLDNDARALRSADQEVARMSALVDQAQIALANHTNRAPFSSSVIALNVEAGQIVDPSTVLMTLADLGDLVVETDVDEAYATQIVQGQLAVLQLAGETATHQGHVCFVSSRVDVSTGGLAVKLTFDAPVVAPIGLTVTSNIVVDGREAALTVPRTAMATFGADKGVFVIEAGKAKFRKLQVVDWPATRLIVTQGLTEGDKVIVDAAGITDGQAVTLGQP